MARDLFRAARVANDVEAVASARSDRRLYAG